MEIKELIELFDTTLNEDGRYDIGADTEFKELDEWSSLTAFNLVESINEKYGIRIRGIELRRCNTITDLLDLLNNK